MSEPGGTEPASIEPERTERAAGPALVHLLGFPGVGKRTIGAALVASVPRDDRRFVLVDNHLTSVAVLAALDTDTGGRVDDRAWAYVHELRTPVLRAIEELAPPGWSYAFTNYLAVEKPSPTLDRLRGLAAARAMTYVPVVLHCDDDEQRRRVVGTDRAARRKWTDPDLVAEDVARRTLVRPDSPHLLDLDVTDLSPSAAAAAVLAHVRSVA